MSKSEFQVIIVGGSIGGLTLAHCLQRAGIDHVVLEKASNPAPQIGASIGISPNGARVLDQLQLYDLVEEQIEQLNTATIRYPDGYSFESNFAKIISERFGYPIAFLDRQKLLEILYQGYPDHRKIRLEERVTKVEESGDTAIVSTAKGSIYRGHLVVGADGVHSKIRQEIWNAVEKTSSKVAIERSSLKAEFRCLFGISSPIKELIIGEQVNAFFDGFTIITIHGKEGRVYWFVIQKLDKQYTYPNCPRYTAGDIETAAEELRSIVFYKDINFGQLWENRETVSMTVLEEHTFDIWHHDRLVLLGDSAHKMTPNIGQGANMAIEDAASLVNLLERLRKGLGTWPPTDGQVKTLLKQYRSIRHGRVNSVYKSSRVLVRLHARDGLLKTLIGRYFVPYAGDFPAYIGSKSIADGIVSAPLEYLLAIPGKDIRGKLISAFNEWLHLPDDKLAIVKEVIDRLHTASLLIDDIQDASRLRRGHPVAHVVFGVAQTINAANYAYFLQQERLNEINDPRAFHIFTQALLDLHIGQGMDLYWRDALVCPTEAEYTRMVMYKTGGLFRLAVELMQIQSTTTTDLSRLVGLLGIIFQIRDDYMNLQSGIYAEKKGLMEDLTEGKFSYPVIHSIRADLDDTQLIDILKQRSEDRAVKVRAVQYMESTGSFQYCREVLSGLMEQARGHVDELEILLGPNQGIHRILDLLQVHPPNFLSSNT
ncbi:hypothetical protein PENFLA_c010G06962 [Penicillium flavigenum]|uniref:FAD-binding domain-containing protein n=1 Tax=Penicillium flavigenum TaxID=254877 RepID=A0A1V6TF31_9EURO|nr:hypothetical protein PENFLA_c010G06962 [Penicillium flavigenum]